VHVTITCTALKHLMISETSQRATRSMGHDELQEGFLERLRGIRPDLCVTAAYGNILPRAFLDIPRHGTLNIHPSLLPRWRGAAPVPRAIEVRRVLWV
jgi:methionyl-tRNA formyltransferase